jgi:hypothetical protein
VYKLGIEAEPYLRWLVDVVSLERLRFSTWIVHVGFVVDQVALRLVSPQVLWVSPSSYSTSALFSHPASKADKSQSTCILSTKGLSLTLPSE